MSEYEVRIKNYCPLSHIMSKVFERTRHHTYQKRGNILKIINFFGGPGISKSTSSAQLFSIMKQNSYNVELVTEYAKHLTWSKSQSINCQPFVFGSQLVQLDILKGQVDYIITDSPILLSCIYNSSPELDALALATHNTHETFNILLNRKKKYNPIGRAQSEAESIEIDKDIRKLLNDQKIPHIQCDGTKEGIERLYDLWISKFPKEVTKDQLKK